MRSQTPRPRTGTRLALALLLTLLIPPLSALTALAAQDNQPSQQETPLPQDSRGKATDLPTFTSIVIVRPDGTLLVHEWRERFPAHSSVFRHENGSRAPFAEGTDAVEILEILADGKPYNARLLPPDGRQDASRKAAGGLVLDAGPGLHDYELEYTARGRILFESGRDRLVWQAWRSTSGITADAACTIILPRGTEILGADSCIASGLVDRQKAVIRQSREPSGRFFISRGPVTAGKFFTCEISWAKGAVAPDEGARRLAWLDRALWAACTFMFLLCFVLWFLFGKDGDSGTVMPRFHPPQDGKGGTLSPAAVNYIASGGRLTSRGFSALLASLSAKNAISVSGSGTKKDPWIMSAPPQGPTGTGPALAPEERIVLKELFPKEGGTLRLDGAGWTLAEARDKAFLSLERRCGKSWELRLTPTVGMNLAALLATACAFGAFVRRHSLDATPYWAVGLFFALFSPVLFASRTRVYRAFCLWKEAGILSLAAMIGFSLLLPAIAYFDLFLPGAFSAEELAGSATGWDAMLWWRWLRIPLCALCYWRLSRVMGSWFLPFLYPLKITGLFLAIGFFFMLFKTISAIPNASWIPLALTFVIPSVFTPLMKRPAPATLPILNEIKGFAMYISSAETERANTLDGGRLGLGTLRQVYPYAIALGLEKAWGSKFAGFASGAAMEGGRWDMISCDTKLRRAGQSF